jgi:hypothetical protein
MADKDKPGGDTPKTPRRRRATTPAKAGAKSRPPRKTKPKTEDAAAEATQPKAKPAPKPRSSKRTTAKAGAKRSRTAAAAPAPATRGGALRDSLDRLGDRVRGPWGAAAIAGGLAAAAALLSLRGSTAKPTDTAEPEKDQPGSDDIEANDSSTEEPDEG